MTQKLARLTSLRQNGRMADPANEAVADTYLDLAVYAVITYAIALHEAKPKPTEANPYMTGGLSNNSMPSGVLS